MPYNVELPDGTLVTDIPDDMPQDEVRRQIIAAYPQFAPKTRTTGEAVSDIGAQLKKGAAQLVQFPGQLYGLATGDFSETGLYGYGKEMEAAAEAAKSPGLKAREAARAAAIAEAEKTGQLAAAKSAIGETITDPALVLGVVAENIPSMLLPLGAAAGVGRAALQKGLAKGVEAAAAREAAIAAGSKAAIRAAAVQQGADVGTGAYEEVYKRLVSQGVSEPEAAAQAINLARAAGVSGAIISLLAQRLPGASKLEEVLAGKTTTAGLGRAMLGGAAGETLGEVPEEVGGRFTQNLALRTIDPTQSLTAGLGETGGMAALAGAGLGGLGGGISSIRGGPSPTEVDAARQQAQRRFLAARERERAEAAAPRGYEDKQGLLFEPTKVKAEKEKLPTDPNKIQAEFNDLAQQEQTPETQDRMAKLARQYEAVMAKQPEAAPEVPAEQMSLGLDAQRRYADMELEAQRLMKQPKTPESKARITELRQQQRQMVIDEITQGQAEQAQRKREEQMAATSAFAPEVPARPTGYTAEGQGRLFTPTEMRESGLRRGEEKPVAEPQPTTPKQMERAGQRRLPFEKAEKPAPQAAITGTTGIAKEEVTPPAAEVTPPSPTEVVPEPKLAPKYPAELQPVMDKLTAAGVRPETQTWAENARNRPFLRKLMDMAPEAAPEARKALKLKEGTSKAEVFDALFPAPRVPAFEPAPGAGESRLGLLGQLGITPPAAPAPRAGKPVRRGVVPAGRAAPAPAAPEVGAKPALKETPPPKPGMVRYYHGGAPEEVTGALWFTSDLRDAKGWASRDPAMRLWYVDVPANSPVRGGDAEYGVLPPARIELPAELAAKRKEFVEPAKPEAVTKPLPSRLRAEQFWKDTAEAVGGKAKDFSELTPEQRAAWREAVKAEDPATLQSEYRRITEEGPSKAEEIRAREQAKREAAEAKRAEQERRKAEKEAEAKRKAEAAAERERAKREAVKPDDLWNKFNGAPGGRFLPFKKLTKGRQREWEAAVAAGTADMDTYQQIAGAQLDAEQARAKAKLDAILESSVATSKRRMAEAAAFEAKREAEAKRKAEEAEAKKKGLFGESTKHPEWATRFESDVGGKVVYSDSEGALLRGFSALTGQYVYTPIETDGRYRLDVDSKLLDEKIPAELLARLRDAKAQLVKEDAAKLAKYPDGPFTGVKGNVASSDGVDARYTDYLRNLMQDLGLGDIRVFMLHPEDLRTADAADKYKLYADWASARSAGLDSGEDGSVRVYGPDRKSFYISLRPGMSEQRTLETIAHELGHLIQRVAYDTAPSNVQKEIRAEYEQWLTQNKGKTARELIQALRNRETAAAHVESVSDTVMASELTSYWTSFSEWFADNVSRWATTDERPVSVVEKFFKAVADKLRALVAAVTGQDYAPAKTVAAFLNKMGPANPISWAGTADTTAQKSRAPSPTEGIAETSELMEDMPTSAESTIRKALRLFLEKDDVPFTTRFRTEVSDAYATVVNRLNVLYDGKVRDELTKTTSPELLMRQAQAAEQMFNAYLTVGGIEKDTLAGQYVITKPPKGVPSHKDVLEAIKKWGDAKGMDFKLAYAEASKMLEAQRLNELMKVNQAEGEDVFTIHKLSQKDDRTAEEQVAAAMRGFDANPEIKEIGKLMDAQRAYMIDKMVEVGRISKDTARQWKDASGYVPFDRIDKFFDKFSPKRGTGRGLAQLKALPKLVGTNRLEVGNVFDNQAKLMTWMLKQTLRQDATYSTLRTLADIGQARDLKGNKHAATNPNNVVKTYKDGIEQYFEVKSHWDMEAFEDLQGPKSYFAKVFAGVSNILRKIVTVMPPFVAKQVTDDIQRAFVTSGVKEPYKLIVPAITNFLRIAGHELVFGKSHPITTEFAKKGLVGDVDYNASNPAEVILFNLGYSQRGWLSSLHHRLESVTRASDLAIRKAIYDRTMVEEKDTGVAAARAREFINFRRRGASQSVGSLIATVPFFNAYIQSTDLLLRSATGRGSASVDRATAKRLFWLQASKMLGFSLIYALVASGDDEYEKLTLDQRANNWVMDGVKLPAPGDLAALFKVPVEATVHYMRRLGTPEEQQASEAVRQTLGYALEQYVGRVSPIPQAVRPIVEAWANRSVVTGRKLVGTYQEGLPAPLQTVTSTSELAKAIAKFVFENIKDPVTDTPLELSPIIIDNTLRGYLGGAVPLLNMLVDQMVNPNKTDRPLSQYWFLSQYLTPEVPQGPKEEFYDLVNKVMPVKRALDKLSKEDMEAAVKYAKENEDKLKMAELVNIGLTDLRQTREYIKYLNSAEGAKAIPDSAERLKQKQKVEEYENKMLDWVRKAKTQIFLNQKG